VLSVIKSTSVGTGYIIYRYNNNIKLYCRNLQAHFILYNIRGVYQANVKTNQLLPTFSSASHTRTSTAR